MSAEPLLIETSSGVIGAVVVTPAGPPRGAVVILTGVGSTRAGSNQMFVEMASSLAAVGISSLRFDYPGTGESHLCTTSRWSQTTTEVIAWFRERCGTSRLLLIADCSGVVPAHREVISGRGVLGVGMVRPAFIGGWQRPSRRQRQRAAAGRVKRFPRSSLLRLRHGARDPKIQAIWSKADLAGMARTDDLLVEVSRRVPLWVLTAETDPATPVLRGLHERLAAGLAYELEVLGRNSVAEGPRPGVAEMARSTAAWAARRVGDDEKTRTPVSAGHRRLEIAPG
jgi:hypothetical protein